MKIQFSLKYLLFTVFLFLIEVLIATSLKNIFFVRAYLGDVIVVRVSDPCGINTSTFSIIGGVINSMDDIGIRSDCYC